MPGMNGIALIRAAHKPSRTARDPADGLRSDGAALAVGEVVDGSYSLMRKPIRVEGFHRPR